MSLPYIRSWYRVPAKRGTRVTITAQCEQHGRQGRITSAAGQYLRVLLDGDTRPIPVHPKEVEYPADAVVPAPRRTSRPLRRRIVTVEIPGVTR